MTIHFGNALTAPSLPPGAQNGNWSKLSHQWTGSDGSVWPISNPRLGVFLTQGGLRGMGMPSHTAFVEASPAVHGDRQVGSSVAPREVFWPLYSFSDTSSEAWVEQDRAWWAGLRRDTPGVWRVEANGEARELVCYFSEEEDGFERDPLWFGWTLYGIRLVARDPFWRGPWIMRQFNAPAAPIGFFGANQAAPEFHISSSSTMATASINNPGDEPSHLVYLLNGPFTEATVGVDTGNAATEYLQPVPAGSSVVIDTRPNRQDTARLIATPTANLRDDPAAWESQVFDSPSTSAFSGTGKIAINSPVHPGQDRQLSLSMVGEGGSVTVAHRPAYNRAW